MPTVYRHRETGEVVDALHLTENIFGGHEYVRCACGRIRSRAEEPTCTKCGETGFTELPDPDWYREGMVAPWPAWVMDALKDGRMSSKGIDHTVGPVRLGPDTVPWNHWLVRFPDGRMDFVPSGTLSQGSR